jgi:hypothetical protein
MINIDSDRNKEHNLVTLQAVILASKDFLH